MRATFLYVERKQGGVGRRGISPVSPPNLVQVPCSVCVATGRSFDEPFKCVSCGGRGFHLVKAPACPVVNFAI